MTDEVLENHPVLLFDGVCNLCVGSIQFLIERDSEREFRFAPLQSTVAKQLLAECGHEGEPLDSVVLLENGEYYTKSDAVIRTAVHLGGIYRLLGPARFVPRRVRNRLYEFIAARRYDWFGRKDQCLVPSSDVQSRFLAGVGPDRSMTDESG